MSVAQACTEVTVGNTTVIITDPPSAVLGRVGLWKLGAHGEVGSGWGIIERSDFKEAVKAEHKRREIVVSAILGHPYEGTSQHLVAANCGPGVVSLSRLRIGDKEILRETGNIVLQAVAETGGR